MLSCLLRLNRSTDDHGELDIFITNEDKYNLSSPMLSNSYQVCKLSNKVGKETGFGRHKKECSAGEETRSGPQFPYVNNVALCD